MYNDVETNKSILEKMASSFVNEDIHIDGLPHHVRSPYSNISFVFYKEDNGNVGKFKFIRNSEDGTLSTLEDFVSDKDIDNEVMENFNLDYGVNYNEKESLEDISVEITYELKSYDNKIVNELVGKKDAFRALMYPDDYTIRECHPFLDDKVWSIKYDDREKLVYDTILPSSTYNNYSAKEVSSLSKKFGVNKANEILNKEDKYGLVSEDEIRELDGCKDGDFGTIAEQLYGDYGMFEGYETFNENDTNYVLVTKKAN